MDLFSNGGVNNKEIKTFVGDCCQYNFGFQWKSDGTIYVNNDNKCIMADNTNINGAKAILKSDTGANAGG